MITFSREGESVSECLACYMSVKGLLRHTALSIAVFVSQSKSKVGSTD